MKVIAEIKLKVTSQIKLFKQKRKADEKKQDQSKLSQELSKLEETSITKIFFAVKHPMISYEVTFLCEEQCTKVLAKSINY